MKYAIAVALFAVLVAGGCGERSNGAGVVKFTPASPTQSVTLQSGVNASRPLHVSNPATLYELLSHYSPLALKGNRRCRTDELRRHSREVPHFIAVRLKRPDTFEAVVASRNQEWPPNVYDSSTRLEQVKFDTITVFHEGHGLARFVFTDTQTNECLFSDPVGSLRLVKEAQGRNPPVFGPDLFDELVSQITAVQDRSGRSVLDGFLSLGIISAG